MAILSDFPCGASVWISLRTAPVSVARTLQNRWTVVGGDTPGNAWQKALKDETSSLSFQISSLSFQVSSLSFQV